MSSRSFQILGDPPFREELVKIARIEILSALPEAEFCNEVSIRELYKPNSIPSELAGIGICIPALTKESDLEMVQVSTVKAKAFEWTFSRNWYYWVCSTETRPLPMAEAQKLNETWGSQARVDGHAGGKDVQGDVGLYHVDTWVGLAVLVAGIRYQALMSAHQLRR